MTPIQFSHANGFPAKSYQYLFDLLAPHDVSYINVLGENKPEITTWQPYLDELIADIETKHNQPVIGVGHSFGGALTLKAAQIRPELFEKIILLDPPIFGRFKRTMISLVSLLGIIETIVPIVKKAKNRRTHFSTKEEAFNYWKPKSFFKKFHPDCFQAYVESGLKPTNDGEFELTISSQQEVNVFNLSTKLQKGPLQIPSYFVYATKNGVLTPNEWKEHQSNFPGMKFIAWEGQHMFPLEEPEKTVELIKGLIANKEY